MPRETLAPGDVLRGKYRVERVLGSGGMGTVVAATHIKMGQRVAIKIVRTDAPDREQLLQRFAREARAASRLRDEHVVRILDVDESDGGEPFLVMEHLDGIDLEHHSEREGPLPIDEAVALVLQACEGIAEAHAAGIVHRDLKPANLFLTTRADGSPLVKILDFGISKAAEVDGPGQHAITKPASAIGSPSYMSPEQVKNAADVDARTDLWSLGVVLYQLLARQLPFEATNAAALAAHIAAEPPTPLSKVRPEVPAALEAIVMRCLEKDRAKRFSDVSALASALAPFAPHGSSAAMRAARVANQRRTIESTRLTETAAGPPDSTVPAASAPLSRRPETADAPIVGVSPLQQALQTEYASTLHASDRPQPTTPPTRRSKVPAAIAAATLVVAAVGAWIFVRAPGPAPNAAPSAVSAQSSSDATPALVVTTSITPPEAPRAEAPHDLAIPDAGTTPPGASSGIPRASDGRRSPVKPPPKPKSPFEIDFK